MKGQRARNSKAGIVTAAREEIARRRTCTKKLERLDGRLLSAAIRTLGSPASAAEWFISRAHGLGGQIPVDVALTQVRRITVMVLLARVECSVLA
jgi:uncharacterized protein (DUF2384 family)